MTPKQQFYANQAKTLCDNLKKRNMSGQYFTTAKEAADHIKNLIPDGACVAFGGNLK